MRMIVDYETPNGFRIQMEYPQERLDNWLKDMPSLIKSWGGDLPDRVKDVVQYISIKTGETIKGPKYDTTTQKVDHPIKSYLYSKQQLPVKPSQYEPRDRFEENIGKIIDLPVKEIVVFGRKTSVIDLSVIGGSYIPVSYSQKIKTIRTKQGKFKIYVQSQKAERISENEGNSSMNEINKFRKMVGECISEVRKENDPRIRLKESLRGVVKKVLNEMYNINKPELTTDEKETVSKGYKKNGNERLDKTNEKQLAELETIVHAIDPTWEVYWDDYRQLIVRAQNLLYVRIVPKFENNFDVDAMVKLVDRVRAIALDWDQVKAFIKANFSDLKNTTIPDQLRQRALDHYKDRDVIKKAAGPMGGAIKNRGEKNNGEDASVKDTKKSDKNYNEKQTKRDEDLPDQPMKRVTEPGKDPDSKNKNIEKTSKVKAPKHKNDKELKTSDKKTSKFTLKQVKP